MKLSNGELIKLFACAILETSSLSVNKLLIFGRLIILDSNTWNHLRVNNNNIVNKQFINYQQNILIQIIITQSAGAVEYTDCTSAEG